MAGVSLPGNPAPFIYSLKTRNEFMIESDQTFVSIEQKSVSPGQKSFQEMKIICSSSQFTDPLISLWFVERASENNNNFSLDR